MLLLAIAISCLWFGIGAAVGWNRSKSAYQIEVGQTFDTGDEKRNYANREALYRAILVFVSWMMAGVPGAIIWFFLYVFLIIGTLELESRAKHVSTKMRKNKILNFIFLAGLVVITQESLNLIQKNVDNFIVKFSIGLVFLIVLATAIAID